MVTKTTEEAIALLEEAIALLNRTRPDYIRMGRRVADELILLFGETNTNQVRDTMQARGLIDDDVPLYWLGAVFRSPKYRFTGKYFVGNPSAATHSAHPVKVWTFA